DEIRTILKETEGIGTARTRVDAIAGVVRSEMLIATKKGKNTVLRISPLGREIMAMLPVAMTNIVVTAQWEMILDRVAKGEVTSEQAIDMQRQLVKFLVKHLSQFNKTKAPSTAAVGI